MFTCRHESFTRDHPYIYINPDHINSNNWELAWSSYQRRDWLLSGISLCWLFGAHIGVTETYDFNIPHSLGAFKIFNKILN